MRRKREAECFNGEDMDRQIYRSPCACSEMDYECDVGYFKTEQGTCQKQELEEALENGMTQD